MEIWGGSRAFTGSLSVPGNEVHVSCTPYGGAAPDAHGGDIYYVSNCAAGLITRVVLADVSGHGEEVAHVSKDLRDLMRKHINTADQSRFAVQLNRAFARRKLEGRFATAILATYFAPTDHLILCNAGHPPPLLYRASDDAWSTLTASTAGAIAHRGAESDIGIANLPLGILDPTGYEQLAVKLHPGDTVVLYTDALVEAKAPNTAQIDLLGERRLLEFAATLSSGERLNAGEALLARVRAFAGDDALGDDATVITLHHTATDPPSLSLRDRAYSLARLLGLARSMIDPADARQHQPDGSHA